MAGVAAVSHKLQNFFIEKHPDPAAVALDVDPRDEVDGPEKVYSRIPLDTSPQFVPREHSRIPGYYNHPEQCGEFVYRYFKGHGVGYPTLGQPAEYIRSGVYKKDFPAFLNGSKQRPRAGDILAAKGPRPGEYHTALIWKVTSRYVYVYQANVPCNTWSPSWRKHLGKFTLERLEDGRWYMPPLPTSHLGYHHDFPVTGWIHPTGKDHLPGAKD